MRPHIWPSVLLIATAWVSAAYAALVILAVLVAPSPGDPHEPPVATWPLWVCVVAFINAVSIALGALRQFTAGNRKRAPAGLMVLRVLLLGTPAFLLAARGRGMLAIGCLIFWTAIPVLVAGMMWRSWDKAGAAQSPGGPKAGGRRRALPRLLRT